MCDLARALGSDGFRSVGETWSHPSSCTCPTSFNILSWLQLRPHTSFFHYGNRQDYAVFLGSRGLTFLCCRHWVVVQASRTLRAVSLYTWARDKIGRDLISRLQDRTVSRPPTQGQEVVSGLSRDCICSYGYTQKLLTRKTIENNK